MLRLVVEVEVCRRKSNFFAGLVTTILGRVVQIYESIRAPFEARGKEALRSLSPVWRLQV